MCNIFDEIYSNLFLLSYSINQLLYLSFITLFHVNYKQN